MLLRTLRLGNIIRFNGNLKSRIGQDPDLKFETTPRSIVQIDNNIMSYFLSRDLETTGKDDSRIVAASIKINEAILLHCGFKKIKDCFMFESARSVFMRKGLYIYFYEGRFGKKFKVHIGDGFKDRDMEYLHHLQNTYYWTVWEELQIDIEFIKSNFSLEDY